MTNREDTPDFMIFRGERDWHVANTDGHLIGLAGAKTKMAAEEQLRTHLGHQPFSVEYQRKGEYLVFLSRPQQFQEFAGKTIDFVTGNLYGNTPFSITIVFTDGTTMNIRPQHTDFGHGDMGTTLAVSVK